MVKSLFFTMTCLFGLSAMGQFNSLITDPAGDGSSPTLLDGTDLSYRYDAASDSVWFRVTTSNMDNTLAQAVGVNVMVNIPGGGSTFNFWGSSNSDPFHYLMTTWVTGTPPNNYTGIIGFADATGVMSQSYTNASSGNISVSVDVANKTITLGMKRDDFFPDALFSGNSVTAKIAAAVGSNQSWNDDLYSSTASITITKSTIGISENDFAISAYPNPVMGQLVIENPEGLSGELFNATGQRIQSISSEARQVVDMTALNSGIYFIVLEDGSKLPITKL